MNTQLKSLPDSAVLDEKSLTGRLMIKFNDNAPEEIAKIFNDAEIAIQLGGKQKTDSIGLVANSIEFTSKEGSKFQLFIQPI